MALLSAGGLLTSYADQKDSAMQIVQSAGDSSMVTAVLLEPLTEKRATWKSVGSAINIRKESRILAVPGGILLYFSKSNTVKPDYGDRIAFRRPL